MVKNLVEGLGKSYSEELGITLKTSNPQKLFEWFLASILFGARISEKIAIKTFNEFRKQKILTPEAILEAGWDRLVEVLDEGGYVRYDFKTATKLLDIMQTLKERYNGNLNKLHEQSSDSKDLEKKLMEFRGVGETTINIFLRELRDIWVKANPPPQNPVLQAAYNLKIVEKDEWKTKEEKLKALQILKTYWEKNKVKGKSFVNFETALIKLGKNFCRKNKCKECPVKNFCRTTRNKHNMHYITINKNAKK